MSPYVDWYKYMAFQKGHTINTGKKKSEQWKKDISEKMKGNRNGFKKGMIAWAKDKKFTEEHRKNISKGHKGVLLGEKHHNWLHDRSKLKVQNRRNDSAYCAWRREVWLRDNFKCKIGNPDCKGRIEAHHILKWSDYPELRYKINNGITLCHFHHPKKVEEEKRLAPQFFELVSVSK